MLGISKYKPIFFRDSILFLNSHKETLMNLIGENISEYYVQWDTSQDEWNEDGPIILIVNDNQYEFTAYQLDMFSLTINKIDLNQKLDWYGSGDEIPLIWKKDAFENLNHILGKEIQSIHLLEYSLTSNIKNDPDKKEFFNQISPLDFFLVGIEFELNKIQDCLHLSNGLDCNTLKLYTTQVDSKNRKFNIAEKEDDD